MRVLGDKIDSLVPGQGGVDEGTLGKIIVPAGTEGVKVNETIALLLTKGGPLNSTYFFAMYIYDNAFKFHDMGYAAAMSWVMFLIILTLSMLVLKYSAAWVHYEGEVKGGGNG